MKHHLAVALIVAAGGCTMDLVGDRDPSDDPGSEIPAQPRCAARTADCYADGAREFDGSATGTTGR